uniref:Uncharacterized protein n=1 Tax=Cyprinodon variegatus TaxID=28743 RepID=A0A3Q2DJ47_CYPVA
MVKYFSRREVFTRPSVLQLEVLIRKSQPINGLPTGSIVVGEVSTLRTGTKKAEQLNTAYNREIKRRTGLPDKDLLTGLLKKTEVTCLHLGTPHSHSQFSAP